MASDTHGAGPGDSETARQQLLSLVFSDLKPAEASRRVTRGGLAPREPANARLRAPYPAKPVLHLLQLARRPSYLPAAHTRQPSVHAPRNEPTRASATEPTRASA